MGLSSACKVVTQHRTGSQDAILPGLQQVITKPAERLSVVGGFHSLAEGRDFSFSVFPPAR
jgi:hypothetical protein